MSARQELATNFTFTSVAEYITCITRHDGRLIAVALLNVPLMEVAVSTCTWVLTAGTKPPVSVTVKRPASVAEPLTTRRSALEALAMSISRSPPLPDGAEPWA